MATLQEIKTREEELAQIESKARLLQQQKIPQRKFGVGVTKQQQQQIILQRQQAGQTLSEIELQRKQLQQTKSQIQQQQFEQQARELAQRQISREASGKGGTILAGKDLLSRRARTIYEEMYPQYAEAIERGSEYRQQKVFGIYPKPKETIRTAEITAETITTPQQAIKITQESTVQPTTFKEDVSLFKKLLKEKKFPSAVIEASIIGAKTFVAGVSYPIEKIGKIKISEKIKTGATKITSDIFLFGGLLSPFPTTAEINKQLASPATVKFLGVREEGIKGITRTDIKFRAEKAGTVEFGTAIGATKQIMTKGELTSFESQTIGKAGTKVLDILKGPRIIREKFFETKGGGIFTTKGKLTTTIEAGKLAVKASKGTETEILKYIGGGIQATGKKGISVIEAGTVVEKKGFAKAMGVIFPRGQETIKFIPIAVKKAQVLLTPLERKAIAIPVTKGIGIATTKVGIEAYSSSIPATMIVTKVPLFTPLLNIGGGIRLTRKERVSVQSVAPISVQAPKLDILPLEKQISTPRVIPIPKPRTVEIPRVIPTVTPIEIPRVIPTITTITITKIINKAQPKVTPTTIFPRTPKIPIYFPPIIPFIPKGKPIKFKGLNLGYRVFTIKRGKKIYMKGVFPKGIALRKGELKTLSTIRATFGIMPTGLGLSQKDISYTPSSYYFRGFKIKKGKRISLPNIYIQKKGKRLSFKSEVRELLGYKKKRRKK